MFWKINDPVNNKVLFQHEDKLLRTGCRVLLAGSGFIRYSYLLMPVNGSLKVNSGVEV